MFLIAGLKIGRRFFFGSLTGMLCSSALIDVFALIPMPATEPLIGALYGGTLCGLGLGAVFAAGASTGGSDIVVRLLKLRWRDVPIGQISMCFDGMVAVITGIVFRDLNKALYTGVTVFLCGKIMDAVVYRFDYSSVSVRFGTRKFTLGDNMDACGAANGEGADGFRLQFKIMKNKTAPCNRGGGFITYRYATGLDWVNDLLEIALTFDFIHRVNNVTYELINLETGELYTDDEWHPEFLPLKYFHNGR